MSGSFDQVLEPASSVLPIDVLVDVFRRLVSRSLAASRCVCREWRDIVDDCRLLRRDLLPLTLRGGFVRTSGVGYSKFFSHPSTGPSICGGALDFLPCQGVEVTDHCKGLLICADRKDRVYVVNPATRRWTLLPPFPPQPCSTRRGDREPYLAYDPTISPHFEVFLVPITPPPPPRKLDPTVMNLAWPPASYMVHVFSSTTRRWEKTTFAREGEATWIIAVDDKTSIHKRHSVYWRGALYAQCQHDSVIRMSLKNGKYQIDGYQFKGRYKMQPHLGRSLKGVYCTITYDSYRYQIWLLNESCSQMEWVLEHHVCLKNVASKFTAREDYGQQMDGPWRLPDDRNDHYKGDDDDHDEETAQGKYDWSSDDDNVLDVQDWVEKKYAGFIQFLGFHPFKEVAFFNFSFNRGVAYHWSNSKFQDLGSLCPKGSDQIDRYIAGTDVFFPYTPCWMEEFLDSHSEADLQG